MKRKSVIVFHGVNTSGGLSLAWTIKNDLAANNMGVAYCDPSTGFNKEALEEVEFFAKPRFVFDHGVMHYPLIKEHAFLITMIREPIRRMMSVYHYLAEKHPEVIYGLSLEAWVTQHGSNFSQVRQFAPPSEFPLTPAQQYRSALKFLNDRIDLLGFCEGMEEFVESVRTLLAIQVRTPLLTIDSGSANPMRGKPVSEHLRRHVEDVLPYDVAFYEAAMAFKPKSGVETAWLIERQTQATGG